MIDLLEARLRSNPRFRLVPYDRMRGSQFDAVRSLSEDPEFFGILIPPEGSAAPVKSLSHDAALLFMALQEPARLPHLLNRLFGARVGERLTPLILDGVFEIERSGQFMSGAAALTPDDGPDTPVPASRLARLCEEAISYAAELDALPVQEVATRLYLFNCAPGTPALERRFADDDCLLRFLLPTERIARLVRSCWRSDAPGGSWLTWHRGGFAWRPGYKLYISPELEHLPPVFACAVEAFAEVRCPYFKLGRGAFGLLRPDKLVAYFCSLEPLQQAAELIMTSIAGTPVQGVPFTAPIDPDGLLSWGMDPPRFEQVLAWQQYQSWRQWLTWRIAHYALVARESGADVPSFVRSRVKFDGVDPQTWSPDLAIWRGPVGTEQDAS
jgi:hypothetical protein